MSRSVKQDYDKYRTPGKGAGQWQKTYTGTTTQTLEPGQHHSGIARPIGTPGAVARLGATTHGSHAQRPLTARYTADDQEAT